MTILFEIVRWILIAGFMTLGAFMFRMMSRSLEETDRHVHLRAIGGWVVMMFCLFLAAVALQVQP